MKVSALIPDSRNANRGTDRGRKLVRESLKRYGAGRSILLDKSGNIIAGNKTAEAAQAVGLENVQIVKSDGSKLVAVQRTDLDINDKAARELAIADNRASEVGLEWDPEILKGFDAEDVDLSPFWDERELVQFWASTAEGAPEPKLDQAAELQKKWGTERGQLWLIGPHRLLCGDSTSEEEIVRVCPSNCKIPALLVTDPPYGVEYAPKWRQEAADKGLIGFGATRLGAVENDDRADWTAAYKLFPGSIAYVWHAGVMAGQVAQHLGAAGLEIRSQIIWAKPSFAISRGHYHWQHEPCWYAVRKGEVANWRGDRSQSTLWEIRSVGMSGSTPEKETPHGTQKPVECMRRPLRNHEGDVYDPFLGSGTTMVAAELEKRICYALEIEPKYVAVALQRMADMGLKPELAA